MGVKITMKDGSVHTVSQWLDFDRARTEATTWLTIPFKPSPVVAAPPMASSSSSSTTATVVSRATIQTTVIGWENEVSVILLQSLLYGSAASSRNDPGDGRDGSYHSSNNSLNGDSANSLTRSWHRAVVVPPMERRNQFDFYTRWPFIVATAP